MAKPRVFTNEQRIGVPFKVLTEHWPPIVEAARELRLAELEALAALDLSPGPETWNELVEANAAAIRFSYDDQWTSYVALTKEDEMGVELGLVVGPVDGAFLWGTKRATEETLTSTTKVHFEAALGTMTPRLTSVVMAELSGESGLDAQEVVKRAAGALYGAIKAPVDDGE